MFNIIVFLLKNIEKYKYEVYINQLKTIDHIEFMIPINLKFWF